MSVQVGTWIDRSVSRPTAWITVQFLYFEQNTCENSLIKTIMYNSTYTNSHTDVEEHLVPFPPVAYLKSGPNNQSSRPSYSHHPAVACDTDSPKRDCLHWPSLPGFSSDSTHSLELFRYTYAIWRKPRNVYIQHRVVMVGQSDGFLPTVASIERLRKHVPVVEVMEGTELPKDLL